MFVIVSWQKVREGGVEDLIEAASENPPDIMKAPGCVAHYVAFASSTRYATIAIFEDKEHADNWAALANDHAERKGLRRYLDSSPGVSGQFSGTVVAAASRYEYHRIPDAREVR